jgi:hypothetical protein
VGNFASDPALWAIARRALRSSCLDLQHNRLRLTTAAGVAVKIRDKLQPAHQPAACDASISHRTTREMLPRSCRSWLILAPTFSWIAVIRSSARISCSGANSRDRAEGAGGSVRTSETKANAVPSGGAHGSTSSPSRPRCAFGYRLPSCERWPAKSWRFPNRRRKSHLWCLPATFWGIGTRRAAQIGPLEDQPSSRFRVSNRHRHAASRVVNFQFEPSLATRRVSSQPDGHRSDGGSGR